MMTKFILKLTIFASPLVSIAFLSIFSLYYVDEFFNNPENIIYNRDVLIGFRYNEANYPSLKLTILKNRNKYPIISLGSSRVLQFRETMFSERFFNAGYTVSSIRDFRAFIELIPANKLPEVIILGLDQWMFNENWDKVERDSIINNAKWIKNNYLPSKNSILLFLKEVARNEIPIKKIISKKSKNLIGMNALAKNTGFRFDGSYYYGDLIPRLLASDPTLDDYNFRDTYSRISSGTRRFQFSSKINQNAVIELRKILQFCSEKEIKIIAILPPFANSVYNKLKMTNKHNYIDLIYGTIREIFEEYDFELYDFTNPDDIQSRDDDFIDGFHGGEVTYLKMLIKIAEKGKILSPFLDKGKMSTEIKIKKNNLLVY